MENEDLYNVKKVVEFFNNNDIAAMGAYMVKHHVSANEVEWELNQEYCLNSIDLKNFLLLSSDTALGIAYDQLNKELKK